MELEEIITMLVESKGAVTIRNQQPISPPSIGTLVFMVQGQGATPVIDISVGGDSKSSNLPGSPTLNQGELYLIPVIALPDWKVTITNVNILGVIFTPHITSVGGSLEISGQHNGVPYSTSGAIQQFAKQAAMARFAQPINSDGDLIYELTLAVPSTNTDTIYIGNEFIQLVPLTPPATGLATVTMKMVRPKNIYFMANSTSDLLYVWYCGE